MAPAAGAPASASALGAGGTLELVVGGSAGVSVDAVAGVLNVTVVNPAAAGFVTVYPCGVARPLASNVNFVAGQTVPNLVVSKLGAGGRVCLYAQQATDLVVDLAGYFPAGSAYVPITNPTRLLDTRTGASAALLLTNLGIGTSTFQTPFADTVAVLTAVLGQPDANLPAPDSVCLWGAGKAWGPLRIYPERNGTVPKLNRWEYGATWPSTWRTLNDPLGLRTPEGVALLTSEDTVRSVPGGVVDPPSPVLVGHTYGRVNGVLLRFEDHRLSEMSAGGFCGE